MKPFSAQMADFDERRTAAGVSYRDLAKVTGIQPANLSRYRRGHAAPSMAQWVKLNDALDTIISERIHTLQRIA